LLVFRRVIIFFQLGYITELRKLKTRNFGHEALLSAYNEFLKSYQDKVAFRVKINFNNDDTQNEHSSAYGIIFFLILSILHYKFFLNYRVSMSIFCLSHNLVYLLYFCL